MGWLVSRFDDPRCRIAVKDEEGGLAILVGAKTAKTMLAAQAASLQ